MSSDMDSLSIYRELADRYDKFGQFSMRDRFLMLAADAAFQAGQTQLAEDLRQRLLRQSRHHMLRPYSTFAEAMAADDVQTYLADLRANYPPETAAELLDGMKGGGKKSAAIDQTQPVDWTPGATPGPTNIPQTAPLVDPYKAGGGTSKPAWQPVKPLRILDEPQDVPDTTSTNRPKSQPLPGRKSPPPTILEPPAPLAPRPTAQIPLATPIPPPQVPAVPIPPPKKQATKPIPAPAPRPVRPPNTTNPAPGTEGGWLSAVLVAIAVLLGLGVAAITLGRPFFPAEWLR